MSNNEVDPTKIIEDYQKKGLKINRRVFDILVDSNLKGQAKITEGAMSGFLTHEEIVTTMYAIYKMYQLAAYDMIINGVAVKKGFIDSHKLHLIEKCAEELTKEFTKNADQELKEQQEFKKFIDKAIKNITPEQFERSVQKYVDDDTIEPKEYANLVIEDVFGKDPEYQKFRHLMEIKDSSRKQMNKNPKIDISNFTLPDGAKVISSGTMSFNSLDEAMKFVSSTIMKDMLKSGGKIDPNTPSPFMSVNPVGSSWSSFKEDRKKKAKEFWKNMQEEIYAEERKKQIEANKNKNDNNNINDTTKQYTNRENTD